MPSKIIIIYLVQIKMACHLKELQSLRGLMFIKSRGVGNTQKTLKSANPPSPGL